MAFELPELPYGKNEFGAFISAEGFDYHHGKHHAAYVNNLNKAITGNAFETMSLEEVIKKSNKEANLPVFNNAAQHWNHSFFWKCMRPGGGGEPTGEIKKLIERDFGSYEAFKTEFSNAAATVFGSGWAFLTMDSGEKLKIVKYSNAGTPFIDDLKGLMTIDVWEHAYYIDHRNARPNFIDSFWKFVNWDFVNNNL